MRDLSLNGRVLLSKSEGLSSQSIINERNKCIYNFIWKNKHHYLNKKILCNPLNQGGLNVLDFEISNTIFKIKWIQNYIRSKDKLWYYIPNIIFEKVGGIEFLLNCNFNISKLPIKLSNFHKPRHCYDG